MYLDNTLSGKHCSSEIVYVKSTINPNKAEIFKGSFIGIVFLSYLRRIYLITI